MMAPPTISEADGVTSFAFGGGVTITAKPSRGRRGGQEIRVLDHAEEGHETVIGFATVDLSDLRERKAFQKAITQRDGKIPDWDARLLLVAEHMNQTAEVRRASAGLCAADIEPREVSWLWPRRIPSKRLGVLGGDPDIGKSMLAGADIAARVSVGGPWPDGAGDAPHGSVIIFTVEDDLADTIVPRLQRHGADLSRIKLFGPQDALDYALLEGLEPLEQRIREQQDAFGPDVLVIFDPLEVFIVGGSERVDTHRTPEVRAALAPLEAIFNRTEATGLGLMHLNKKSTESTLYRFGGALAFVAASRAALIAAYDPQDSAEDENQRLRVFATVKGNLGPKPPVLSYRIVNPGVIDWQGTVTRSIVDLLRPADRDINAPVLEEAKAFLLDELSSGPVPTKKVLKDAHDAGLAEKTLRRAKEALGVVAQSEGQAGQRGAKRWLWVLPEDGQVEQPIKMANPDGQVNQPDLSRAKGEY